MAKLMIPPLRSHLLLYREVALSSAHVVAQQEAGNPGSHLMTGCAEAGWGAVTQVRRSLGSHCTTCVIQGLLCLKQSFSYLANNSATGM